jgi:hypothetical protein
MIHIPDLYHLYYTSGSGQVIQNFGHWHRDVHFKPDPTHNHFLALHKNNHCTAMSHGNMDAALYFYKGKILVAHI